MIIIDFKDVKCAKDKNYVISRKEKCKVEQVPESWEELKELCKNIKGVKVSADCISIGEDNHETYFLKDGTMGKENGEDVWWNTHIAVNRKPAQMWNIIKNLIGEQNGNKNKI